MLKVFLWLTGIFICQALTQEQYKQPCWRRNNKYLEPFSLGLNRYNYSRCAKPYYPGWSPYRRYFKPLGFYPYYTGKRPYIYSMPSSKQRYKHHQFDRESINLIPKEMSTTSDSYNIDDIKMVEFNDKLISNDSVFHVSKNETMIISPSLLIGHKNKSSHNDDWIISNKPINILIKKFPKNRTILEVHRKLPNRLLPSSQNDIRRTCVKDENKCQKSMSGYPLTFDDILSHNKEVSTPESGFDQDPLNDFLLLAEQETTSTQCIDLVSTIKFVHHFPKKKKKVVTHRPFICENVGELCPDAESDIPLKKHSKKSKRESHNCKNKGLEKIKDRSIACKHVGENKGKKCLKRSCKRKTDKIVDSDYAIDFDDIYDYHSQINDSVTEDDKRNCDDYLEKYLNYDDSKLLALSEPTVNYNSEKVDYPEEDYDLIELTTEKGVNPENYLSPKKYLKPKKLKDLKKCKKLICFIEEPMKPLKNVKIIYGNNAILPESQKVNQFVKPNVLCNKHSAVASNNQFKGLSEIKHLTDELIEKVSLLTNSTFDVNCREASKVSLIPNFAVTGKSVRYSTTGKREINNLTATFANKIGISYEEEKPLLDSMFISPNKAACERTTGRRCVCSPVEMINFFSNELHKSSETKVLLKKLITYSCEVFVPIGVEYHIASDMKPRLISKKKRELIESESGPREIRPSVFDELMMRGIPKQGVDFYVFPSTTVEIPCFTSDEMKLSPNLADSASYQWSHSNLKAITEGRILEDMNHKGSLTIEDVTLGDSDNYTCSVVYVDPDTQNSVERSFVHAVKVVVLPNLALHTNIHYCASLPCDQELLEMFELYLPQQIESFICNIGSKSLCSIEIHNPVCYTKSKQDTRKRSIDPRLLWRTDYQKSRWIREILNEDVQEMEMSLNYELDLARVTRFIPESLNMTSCSPHCQQKIALKTIELLRDSFLDALLIPVRTRSVYYEPSLDSINIRMLTACDGGLELKEGFCVPCKRHHYSEHGKTVCLPCPDGYYQDNIGAKSCVACPHPFRPNCFCLGTLENFTVLATTSVSAALLICVCWLGCLQLGRRKHVAAKKVDKKIPDPLPPDFE